MNNKGELILLGRTISNFPLISIGTGLALETLTKPDEGYYDVERKIEYIVKENEYKTIWINAYTILRNIISSISTTDEKHEFLSIKDSTISLVTVFLEEYTEIERLLRSKNYNPVLIIPDYSKNKQLIESDRCVLNIDNDTMSSATIKAIKSAVKLIKKDYYSSILVGVKNHILEGTDKSNSKSQYLDSVISELKSTAKLKIITTGRDLILTHFYIDLLNIKYLSSLTLLESHTGRLYAKKDFNKKYADLSSLDFSTVIPFTEKEYYIFGDNNLIKPYPAKIRKLIHTLFIKEHINPTSKAPNTDRAVKNGLTTLGKEFIDEYKSLKVYY